MLVPTYQKQYKTIHESNNNKDKSHASTSILNKIFQNNEGSHIVSNSSGDLPIDMTNTTNISNDNSDLNTNLPSSNTKNNHDYNDVMTLNNKLSFENKPKH